ncbi:hypothetical protein WS73_06370 [Burkholderia savannae]|nr:hypothetical protein WS91_09485 [Burkholderia sp. MSMB1498]KWZ48138.1 hypothetical protein WS73_06370 [Burkholderia savannae]
MRGCRRTDERALRRRDALVGEATRRPRRVFAPDAVRIRRPARVGIAAPIRSGISSGSISGFASSAAKARQPDSPVIRRCAIGKPGRSKPAAVGRFQRRLPIFVLPFLVSFESRRITANRGDAYS